MPPRRNPWIGLGLSAWSMGVECSTVIGMRALKVAAGGPPGHAETNLMVSEKVAAAFELQALALTGGLGLTPISVATKALSHYRRKVRANRRRLAKG
jgi:hypothetical protein